MESELPFFHLDQAEREGDHVILCSTFEFLFEFQNRIFLEFFVRVSSCSNIKPFEVRGSAVLLPITCTLLLDVSVMLGHYFISQITFVTFCPLGILLT
jgi:hypothetical protein